MNNSNAAPYGPTESPRVQVQEDRGTTASLSLATAAGTMAPLSPPPTAVQAEARSAQAARPAATPWTGRTRGRSPPISAPPPPPPQRGPEPFAAVAGLGDLRGARSDLEVRLSSRVRNGFTLWTTKAIPPGGFVACQMGAWVRVLGGEEPQSLNSAYCILLDDWMLTPPTMRSTDDFYLAARINEPDEGEDANSFGVSWYQSSQVLAGESGAIACLAIHAGAEGIDAETEIKWHYGKDYEGVRRRRKYKAGSPCKPMKKQACEQPASYFGAAGRVPEDAYRRE